MSYEERIYEEWDKYEANETSTSSLLRKLAHVYAPHTDNV